MRAHLRTWIVGLLVALSPMAAAAAVDLVAASGPASAVAGCPAGTNWDTVLHICD